MFTKAGVLALCAAASFNGATAAAHHRHGHPKRELVYAETELVVVTEYVTKTVYAGEEPASTAAAAPTVEAEGAKAVSQPQEQPTPIVVPTTTVSLAPATPTTLATSVKPSSVAVDAPVASPAPAEVASSPAESPVEEPTTPTQAAAPVDVKPTTAAPATTTTAPQSSSSSKRGAAYNDPNMVKALVEQSDAISWVYNWGNEAWGLEVDIPFYPTMWGEKMASDWMEKAQAAVDKGTEVLFSFNECDNAGQANMAPAYAAARHQEWMNPFAGQARISAPSISSSQEKNQGIDWLNQFFDACGGKCQVDFCNAHWYGPGGEAGAEEFLTHLEAVRDVEGCQGKPVWVTEFMPQGSSSENETFMKKVVESLESSEYDFVEKYSYFMVAVGDTYLMSSETELNTLGKIYANVA